MIAPTLTAISYSYDTAALVTGHSKDTIQRAVRAGDLSVKHQQVDGRIVAKPVIEHDELVRWIKAGVAERGAA